MNQTEDIPAIIAAAQRSAREVSSANPATYDELSKSIPPDWDLLKDGSRSQVGAVSHPDYGKIVLKYYYPKTIFKKINYRFRGSRCLNSWVFGKTWQAVDLPSPPPLAIREFYSHFGLVNRASFLATNHFQGDSLTSFPLEELEKLLPRLQDIFERLQQLSLCHGDLKGSNILVGENRKLSFIDLDGASFAPSEEIWIKRTKRDCETFLKNWSSKPDHRDLMESAFAKLSFS